MFWSGNYIAVREVKFLLKEENVTLTQVLEADDVLHECRADNKDLTQFLIKPEIRAELITLITEEPPKHVELSSQYRHANIASEVLSSQLTLLRDHLAMDTVQMNRLCDFVNKDPPLNPLLASYFSKTIEMLLVKSHKQDWYGHRIGCLQVLDFFKSRRDFLPNLLRHMSTSAICDVFKCFLHLSDFNKIIMEWLDEYQFLECLIQIICGTYEPEEVHIAAALEQGDKHIEHNEKDQIEQNEKTAANHKLAENKVETDKEYNRIDGTPEKSRNGETEEASTDKEARTEAERRRARLREVASSNAEALLSDIVLRSCARDLSANLLTSCGGPGACAKLCARLRCADGVRALLAGAFTAPPAAAHAALVHAARLLLRLLTPAHEVGDEDDCPVTEYDVVNVERAVAPHVPLLHNALLRPPAHEQARGVGEARVAAAAVLARLASSELDDVLTALLSLGTAHVLLDLLFAHPDNNFLHAQVYLFVRNALTNVYHGDAYAHHLLEECKLSTRLMDAFDENEDKVEEDPGGARRPRPGYMGHAIAMLRVLDEREECGSAGCGEGEAGRWLALREERLRPLLVRLDTPLGGSYPSETQYEDETLGDSGGSYDLAEGVEGVEGMECMEGLEGLEGAGVEEARDGLQLESARNHFLELINRRFDDDMWDDSGADVLQQVLADVSPWDGCAGAGEGGDGGAGEGGEAGWAQFDAFAPLAWGAAQDQMGTEDQSGLERDMQDLQVGEDSRLQDALTIKLAHKMLNAISGLAEPPEPPADPAPAQQTASTELAPPHPGDGSPADTRLPAVPDASSENPPPTIQPAVESPPAPEQPPADPPEDPTAPPALGPPGEPAER